MNQIENLENLNNFYQSIFLGLQSRLRKDVKEIITEEMYKVVDVTEGINNNVLRKS